MKISKDSWHYKLLTKDVLYVEGLNTYNISDSLCGYFWQVVYRAIALTFFLLVLPIAVLNVAVVLPLVQVAGYLATGYWDVDGAGAAVLVSELLCVSTGALVWLTFWAKDKIGDVKKPKPVSIFTEYVKAKHKRVCPMLEFTDAE